MVSERRARVSLYCGPLSEISRRELPALERKGEHVAERKFDGVWCSMRVGFAGPCDHRFESRTGLELDGSDVDGLQGIDMGSVGDDTILIGELETATESATKTYRELGYRRIWLHDLIRWQGSDLSDKPFGARAKLLRTVVWHAMPKETQKRVLLTPQAFSGFVKFYDDVLADGGEGIVVKSLLVSGKPTRADGKTPDWIRVKPWHTVDYVVMGPARTEKQELSAMLGLYRGGKFEVVMQCQLPDLELDGEHLVQEGRVVEVYGREMLGSGALRHATFSRWRNDKSPEDCTGVHRPKAG